MTEAVIKARALSKRYGRNVALRGVDLEIPPGRIVGIIGPNGAGKTTALKAILGLTSFRGELSVLGKNPARDRDELMREVCFIADVAVLPSWIRVWQLVDFVERIHPRFDRQRCLDFLKTTKITTMDKVRTLSKGMVAQLHLALVMAIDARLLVLDEPTLGLDILFRKQFYGHLLNEYYDEHRTIIVTTHQVEEIEHILTDLVFIRDGEIVLDTPMEAIEARYAEVMVGPDSLEAALALNPIHTRKIFGRHIMLFEDVDRQTLKELGEIHRPSIADLFVATMSGGQS